MQRDFHEKMIISGSRQPKLTPWRQDCGVDKVTSLSFTLSFCGVLPLAEHNWNPDYVTESMQTSLPGHRAGWRMMENHRRRAITRQLAPWEHLCDYPISSKLK